MRRLLPMVALLFAFKSAVAAGVDEGRAALERDDFATALRIILPLLSHNEVPGARSALAKLSWAANGCPAALRSAIEDLRRQAEAGSIEGAFLVGMLNLDHQLTECGSARDPDDRWLILAAENGYVEAQFWLGFGAAWVNEHETMLKWLSRCADGGLPMCQAMMAELFFLPGDPELGIPQDIPRAVTLIKTAAEHGLVVAQLKLSELYQNGTGVPLDTVQALVWLDVAAMRAKIAPPGRAIGPEIMVRRANLTRAMSADDIVRAETLARTWQTTSSP